MAIGITPDGKVLVQPGTRRKAKKKPAKLDAMKFSINGETHSIMVPAVKARPVVRPIVCEPHTVKRGDVYERGGLMRSRRVVIVFDVKGAQAMVRTRGPVLAYRASKIKTFTLGREWRRLGQKEANQIVRAFVKNCPDLAAVEGLIAAPKARTR